MDIEEFDWLYPTPAHAAAAERRERLSEVDRVRFDYLLASRKRSVEALTKAAKLHDRLYIQENIDMADRMLATLASTSKHYR